MVRKLGDFYDTHTNGLV